MRAAFLLCLALLGARAAAFDVFLEVLQTNGAPLSGSSPDPVYAGWINVLSFGSGLARVPAPPPGGEVTALREFTIVKRVDAATPALFEQVSKGLSIGTVKMVVALTTASRAELWDIEAKTCVLNAQQFSASESGEVAESVTFLMERLEWTYMQVAPDGFPLVEFFANWNTATTSGTSTVQTRAPDYRNLTDTDGDGMPDWWETVHGFDPAVTDGAGDADGDGLENRQEYAAHTDPRSPNSVLRITAVQKPGTNLYNLTWRSVAGLTYRILSAPAPGGTYTQIQTVPSAGDGTTSTTVISTAPPLFLRVAVP